MSRQRKCVTGFSNLDARTLAPIISARETTVLAPTPATPRSTKPAKSVPSSPISASGNISIQNDAFYQMLCGRSFTSTANTVTQHRNAAATSAASDTTIDRPTVGILPSSPPRLHPVASPLRVAARNSITRTSSFKADPTAAHVTAEEALETLRQSGSIRKAARSFYAFDKDADGKLMPKDLQNALAAQKMLLSDKEVQKLMKIVDDDGDGSVEINEFLRHCHSAVGRTLPRYRALSELPAGVSPSAGNKDSLKVERVQKAAAAVPDLLEALPTSHVKVGHLLESLDKDQDSFITTDELKQYLRRRLLKTAPPERVAPSVLASTIAGRLRDGFGLRAEILTTGTEDASKSALASELPFDKTVDEVVSMCDRNGDGHVDAADLRALTSALHSLAATSVSVVRKAEMRPARTSAPTVERLIDANTGLHCTRECVSVPAGGGVSASSDLRFAASTPYWMLDTRETVIPSTSAPSYIPESARLCSMASSASISGLNRETMEERLKARDDVWKAAASKKAQQLSRITEAYALERESQELRSAQADEARRNRAAAQRSVIGDYITGQVSLPTRTSKRTYTEDQIPGYSARSVPFKLWYNVE